MGIPVVEHNTINLTLNTSISAADLFSTTDPDGDAIDFYLVEDYQSNPNGGFFSLGGVAQPNGTRFRVEASELNSLTYQAGSQPLTEGFRVIAFDVTGEFSNPANFGRVNSVRTTNLVRPIVQDIPASVLANEALPASEFLSAFDPDGFPITRWFIRDRSVDSGFFTVNGVPQPQGEYFFVEADELDQVAYNGFNSDTFGVASTEQLDKFAFDGVLWSEFSTSELTTLPNVNHSVAQSTQAPNVLTDELISLSPFSVATDDDGNTIKFYEFRNTSPHAVHGDLILDGVVQPRQEWFQVSAEQLREDRLLFEGGETDIVQQIRFRGNDGNFTGISGAILIDNDSFAEVQTVIDGPGLIFEQQLEGFGIDELFPAIGDSNLVVYQFYDASGGDGASARFEFNMEVLEAGVIHEFTPEQVANNVIFSTGNDVGRSTDDVYVRALNDRGNWAQWERLTVRTEPEYIRAIDVGSDWLSIPGIRIDEQGRASLPYSFIQLFPDYETGEATDDAEPNNFSPLNADQRDAVRLAFDQFEAISNFNFFEVSDNSTNELGGQGGIFRFGNYGQDSGRFNIAFGPTEEEQGGDIWFNRFTLGTPTEFDPETGDPIAFDDPILTPGSLGFSRGLLDGILQALGNVNVFEPADGSTILPLDTTTDAFSILSGIDGMRPDGLFPTTPQLYDVEAIQRNYGVNTDFNAGDTLYTLTDNSSRTPGDAFVINIWDGGGNDTFSLVGSDPTIGGAVDNSIDLRSGSFSSVNGFENNISIALRAEIENAIGSGLADTLIGNHLGNSIDGGAGNDLIDGQAGDDFLVGGAGSDRFIFGIGDGSDVIDEQRLAGRDTIEIREFGNLDLLSEDFRFRLEGRDLIINLHLDDQESTDGTLRITNHLWGGSRIETLDLNGTQIDLRNLGEQATAVDQNFALTQESSGFGRLVTPV